MANNSIHNNNLKTNYLYIHLKLFSLLTGTKDAY